ncbi:MAG: hypothetical protein K5753_03920 [Clostridia bacterium]|nr:hypothetical protein [Clostridia bacterium]
MERRITEKSIDRDEARAKRRDAILSILLIAGETAAFVILHFSRLSPIIAKLCVVLLPFGYSLANLSFRSLKGYITQIALAFTVAADCVFLFAPEKRVLAITLFIAVQLSYCIRLLLPCEKKVRSENVCARLALIALFWIYAGIRFGFKNALPFVTLFYAVNLIGNLVSAFALSESKSLRFGFLFFFACDLFVALTQYAEFATVFSPAFSAFLTEHYVAWYFYPEALTLLALSSNERAFPHDSPPKSKNSGCNE